MAQKDSFLASKRQQQQVAATRDTRWRHECRRRQQSSEIRTRKIGEHLRSALIDLVKERASPSVTAFLTQRSSAALKGVIYW